MRQWNNKMEEADDDSQCSDISDPESGIDTQSSGFVELSDRTLSEDENASLKSESGTSNGKPKKRVTFCSGENLVLIREIPPRENKSDTDTAVESDSETTSSESESETEQGGLEEEKVTVTKQNTIQKRNYDVSQSSGKSLAKVAQITGAKLPQQQDKNKPQEVKKTIRRRKKRPVSEEVTETATKNVSKNKNVKGKQIPKPKTVKTNKPEKPENEIKVTAQAKTKVKEPCKVVGAKTSVTRERPKSAPVETAGSDHCSSCPQCFRKNRSSDSNFITGIGGIRCQCLNNNSSKAFWEIESDLSDLRRMDNIFQHNNNRNRGVQNGLTSQSMHEFSSFHKLDMSLMSKNNKRLYSWLMANGNIPNPRDEAPSIAPMWDSSQTAMSENSIVKAPT